MRDNGKAFAELNADIVAVASNVGHAAVRTPATAVATAATMVAEMVLEMLRTHRLGAAGSAADAHRAAQNAPVLLMSAGDLIVGYLLVQQAEIAASHLAGDGLNGEDRAFYAGKVSAATFFASALLPELTAVAGGQERRRRTLADK